jgi:hypothetical protein
MRYFAKTTTAGTENVGSCSDSPAILVVNGEAEQMNVICEVLRRLCSETEVEIVQSTSVRDAVEKFNVKPWRFALLVVDIDAPRLELLSSGGSPGGGRIFIQEFVLTRNIPTPPIIFTSFLGIAKSSQEVTDQASEGIPVLDIGNFTDDTVNAKLQAWGIPSAFHWPLLFDEAKLGEQGAKAYVDSLMNAEVEGLRDETNPGPRLEDIWNLILRIDDSLSRRPHLLDNDDFGLALADWCRRLQLKGEVGGADQSALLAWFHLLEAEILWRLDPVESFYSTIGSIRLTTHARREPLGQPGDPVYRVANRLHAARTNWFCRLRFWLASCCQLARSKGQSEYSEQIWHDLLRVSVRDAVRHLKGNTGGLLNIERTLRGLSRHLQDAGYVRAFQEVEARTCEVRMRRLNGLEWFLYLLLHKLCDFGNRPLRLFVACVSLILFFALLYLPMPPWFPSWAPAIHFKEWPFPADGSNWDTFVTAVYFSIVTFVTLGYGDITPLNALGKFIASFEATLGFTMFGLFVAVASSRLRPN